MSNLKINILHKKIAESYKINCLHDKNINYIVFFAWSIIWCSYYDYI